MASTTTKSAFWRGLAQGAPFVVITSPFGLLFGVVGTEAGLNISEIMGFTVLVIAGASQFAAVQLMTENAPTIVVVLTALAVNLRMAMYSAALAPHLREAPVWKRALLSYGIVDQTYALGQAKFEAEPEMTISERIAFFVGSGILLFVLWYISTYIGAVFGALIPPAFALDFALPISFLALVAPALKSIAHIAAAFTSIVLALALAFVPFSLGLIIAAIVAMCVGAFIEVAMERRAA